MPPALRAQLSNDPWMHICCLKDENCGGRIEFHHALIFAGRAVQAAWAILPVCQAHHAIADRKDIRPRLVALMRERGGEEVTPFEVVRPLR